MKYRSIYDQLIPNEKVLLTCRRHWFFLLNPFTLFIVPIFIPDFIFFWPIRLILWLRFYVVITNKRLLITKGFLSPDTRETRLDKIASIKLDQNLIGTWCNYGTIIIQTIGGEHFFFKKIKDARLFRQVYNEALDKA